MLSVLVLAVTLAIDAAAVAANIGARRTRADVAAAALTFGIFQAVMSGIGALGGSWLASWAAAWDHWIAFVLLAIVGGKMIRGGSEGEEEPRVDVKTLIVLGFATSVDALAAGVSIPMMGVSIAVAAAVVGVVTAAMSMAAGVLGQSAGDRLGPVAEKIGGVVLIAIGVKIVAEHIIAGT